MRTKIFCAPVALFCLSLVVLVRAQDPAPAQSGSSSHGSSVDNQGVKNYLLGPGDLIDVRVFAQPDLNTTAEVDSDGNISSLPFLEAPIPARCRTEKQVQADIALAYGKYIKNPQVSVRITERKSRPPAAVFGAVRQPTRIQMQRPVRLNELMAASGGFTERAAGTIQILHTEPILCPGPGDIAEAAPIDSTRIPLVLVKIADLRAGKQEANPLIRPGDFVLVTEAEPVYITGMVNQPQGIYLRDKMTLSMALGMVGGIRKEAKATEITIYRQKQGTTEQDKIVANLTAIKKRQQPDILLQPYDVIDVPEASMFSSNRIGQTVMGALTGSIGNIFSTMGSSLPMRVIY